MNILNSVLKSDNVIRIFVQDSVSDFLSQTFNLLHPRGGYLVYLTDGDVPFFRVSFSPIFTRTGYQKKANFLEQVVKTCKKRKFC